MNFLLKYSFECKICSKTSKCNLRVRFRDKLYKKMGRYIQLTCSKCKENQRVDINLLEANFPLFPIISIVLFFLYSSYWLGDYFYRTYWRGNVLIDNKSLAVIFFGYALPIVLLVFILRGIEELKKGANNPRIDLD
jgi:hypothetical protein